MSDTDATMTHDNHISELAAELEALQVRLRAVESSTEGWSSSVTTNWYRNPDGPAAADAIDTLLAALKARGEKLERIGKFVDDYFAPWGSWKTAWWEGEVSDDAAFSDNNALMHVANIARTALEGKPA